MKMNRLETFLMNNPCRTLIQHHIAAPRLLALGGPMQGGRALEIGCGKGEGAHIILKRFAASEVVALDLDEEMVARAQRRLRRWGDRAQVRVGSADGHRRARRELRRGLRVWHHPPRARLARGARRGWRACCARAASSTPRSHSRPLSITLFGDDCSITPTRSLRPAHVLRGALDPGLRGAGHGHHDGRLVWLGGGASSGMRPRENHQAACRAATCQSTRPRSLARARSCGRHRRARGASGGTQRSPATARATRSARPRSSAERTRDAALIVPAMAITSGSRSHTTASSIELIVTKAASSGWSEKPLSQ